MQKLDITSNMGCIEVSNIITKSDHLNHLPYSEALVRFWNYFCGGFHWDGLK